MVSIRLDLINTSGRLRAADADQVAALAESMREVGLINPVTVWKTKIIADNIAVDGYGLVAGLHRIEAATALGWDEIEAHVVDLPDLKRQLAECDENLCGTKLSPAARARFTQRRKDIYIAIHPETRHGGDRASCQVGDLKPERFTADTAKKTGQSERAVQRDASRGERVSEDVLTQIAGTKLDTGKTLDELALVSKDAQPARLAEIAERKAVKPAPAPLNDLETEEQWMSAIMRVWNRAAPQWRGRFLETVDRPVFDNTRAA